MRRLWVYKVKQGSQTHRDGFTYRIVIVIIASAIFIANETTATAAYFHFGSMYLQLNADTCLLLTTLCTPPTLPEPRCPHYISSCFSTFYEPCPFTSPNHLPDINIPLRQPGPGYRSYFVAHNITSQRSRIRQ